MCRVFLFLFYFIYCFRFLDRMNFAYHDKFRRDVGEFAVTSAEAYDERSINDTQMLDEKNALFEKFVQNP